MSRVDRSKANIWRGRFQFTPLRPSGPGVPLSECDFEDDIELLDDTEADEECDDDALVDAECDCDCPANCDSHPHRHHVAHRNSDTTPSTDRYRNANCCAANRNPDRCATDRHSNR